MAYLTTTDNGEYPRPELVFLDINMPDFNGIDFLQSLVNTPMIIFTTAYDSFALNAFKVNAIVDMLYIDCFFSVLFFSSYFNN